MPTDVRTETRTTERAAGAATEGAAAVTTTPRAGVAHHARPGGPILTPLGITAQKIADMYKSSFDSLNAAMR